MQYYVGIDIGGMTVKGVLADGCGKVFSEGVIATDSDRGAEAMSANIVTLIERLISEGKVDRSEIVGVGVGCPGVIDSGNGTVVFAGNLNLKNYKLAEVISERTGLAVKITNDANAATLGEAKFGAGNRYKNSILVTLGTGVGGGVIIDGKLFEGGKSAGTEIGHMVIVENGLKCTCGRRGCLERYASASALMEQTREAMSGDPDSKMWGRYSLTTVTGKTPFEYCDGDQTAKRVVDTYIRHLACGIISLANIFRPEVIMLGGGVSEQGERLTAPLQKLLDEEIIGGIDYAPVKVVKATLGSRAGAFGAAALFM